MKGAVTARSREEPSRNMRSVHRAVNPLVARPVVESSDNVKARSLPASLVATSRILYSTNQGAQQNRSWCTSNWISGQDIIFEKYKRKGTCLLKYAENEASFTEHKNKSPM